MESENNDAWTQAESHLKAIKPVIERERDMERQELLTALTRAALLKIHIDPGEPQSLDYLLDIDSGPENL